MTTQRIFASLLAVAGSVSLIAIVPGVALASGGDSSTPIPEVDPELQEVDPELQEVDPEIDPELQEVDPEIDPELQEVDPEIDPELQEVDPEFDPNVLEVDPELQEVDPEVEEPVSDPTRVPEPGTILGLGALAMMSVVSIKRRMKR